MSHDTIKEIAAIRKALRKHAPKLSVCNGRGTAWGWVEISGSAGGGCFTDDERKALVALDLSPGGNFCVISPDSRGFWLKKLTGEKPTGPGCIVCRTPGVESFFCPCDLHHWLCEAHLTRRRDCAFINQEALPK